MILIVREKYTHSRHFEVTHEFQKHAKTPC